MTPTPKLRFVNGKETFETGGPAYRTYRVLQQWWVAPDSFDMITGQPAGEWRDVPLEQEQA